MAFYEVLPAKWEFTAGRLCLDFANTVGNRGGEPEIDYIGDYAALIAWCGRGGLLGEREEQHLLMRAREDPRAAAAAHGTATRLRNAMFTVFLAVAEDRKPEPDALELVNRALSDSLANLLVVEAGGGFAWDWRGRNAAFDSVLWPVSRSAGELLTATELPRVRQCANDPCKWLFLDTTKNHSRRWCVMEACGNQAKGRRHYARQRAARAGAGG